MVLIEVVLIKKRVQVNKADTHFFYWQLDFPSEPAANKILENEPESCLTVD